MSQFAKGAKSAEELAAERKKKAKAAEYDSEEETEEEWSARYDAQEAEKKAEQEKKASGAPTFKLSAPSSNASSDAESGPKSVFGFPKPTASGASSNGLYGSRIGSPAPSTTGGASVFDSPHIGQTPASGNIFGHLPSGAESNGQDEESDEEEQEEEQSEQTGEQSQAEQTSDYAVPSSSSKRKFADSESDETLEETMRRRKQGRKSPSATEEGVSTPMPAKRDLFSRITRDPPAKDQSVSEKDEAEKDKSEEDAPSSDQSNGISKTPDKLYQPFDFSSASKGIGGASTGFNPSTSLGPVGGDQTYKQGSPIKFGQGVQNPVVNVQPSTPSPAELFGTPGAKFNFNTLGTTAPSFLTPSAGQSGVNSGVSSLFSSRAPTPSLSADETSGKESAAENENGEGDDPQLNLYKDLTPEEKEEWDILFHADAALAKHMVKEPDADGKDVKKWQNFARGPLWVLKNKNTGKALVRIRVSSGATPVNYFILPKVLSRPTGKMVFTPCTTKAGKPDSYYFAFRAPELAKEFSETYNGNLPS
ncbi:hypothetical protein K469DRAFT_704000 [Zopfia rhizophila CBS 207.26]|uniref:RanBD1 domain-containing protein n=1 Tax=Zopfia rhizophila CBS 207.26 TaxID=1314779 RepID=A0A6A6D611_9PEZI|nr:hypothetical protein K469DRAFT_704000 [Zopfia rhizophila CBS 207.26]